MEELKETADEALRALQDAESRRERAIRCSREIIRETKKMIHSIHVSEDNPKTKEILLELVSELRLWVGNDPLMMCIGPADDALAEFAEAMIFDSVVSDKDIPSFRELGIDPRPWALGLADSLGEMRRAVLTALMSEDLILAVSMFSKMETIFNTIMMFDIPDAILPIRRKQDIARGVMERTRTDITNAVIVSKMRT